MVSSNLRRGISSSTEQLRRSLSLFNNTCTRACMFNRLWLYLTCLCTKPIHLIRPCLYLGSRSLPCNVASHFVILVLNNMDHISWCHPKSRDVITIIARLDILSRTGLPPGFQRHRPYRVHAKSFTDFVPNRGWIYHFRHMDEGAMSAHPRRPTLPLKDPFQRSHLRHSYCNARPNCDTHRYVP